MRKPQCTIFAGPNGSGKSAIYDKMRNDVPGVFINADQIALSLRSQDSTAFDVATHRVRAGRIAIEQVNRHIAAKRDFVFETTLSSRHSLDVMRRARQSGFDVGLMYVILDSSQRNLDRVDFRVRTGGHHIPDADVVRRYENSLKNLPVALKLADEAVIIDNSRREPLYLFEMGRELIIREYDGDIDLHRRLLKIVEIARMDAADAEPDNR